MNKDSLWQLHREAAVVFGKEKSCDERFRYLNPESAEKSASALTKQYKRDMEHYPCPFCNNWHVGGVTPVEVMQAAVQEYRLQDYIESTLAMMDYDGIHPLPFRIYDKKYRSTKFGVVTTNALPGFLDDIKASPREEIQQIIIGSDHYCKDGQGTTKESVFIVVCLICGEPPRVGVIEYNSPEDISEVNWQGPEFWVKQALGWTKGLELR